MKTRKAIWKVIRSALMVFGIVALLGVYIFTVSDLPSRVYTDTQREFLAYNQMRSIQQIAPTLNFKLGDGISIAEGEVLLPLQLPWQKSVVKAILQSRFEEEGGVSVAVYDLIFSGVYDLTHTGEVSATVDLFFPFPANLETYHEVTFLVDDEEPEDALYSTAGISWRAEMAPGDSFEVAISYRAEGANSFSYGLMQNQRTDIDITVDVIGLQGSEAAKGSLPESSVESAENSEYWAWHYDGLIADRDIRLNLPKRLNFAQRVAAKQADYRALSQAAPLVVGIFLITLAMVFRAQNTRLSFESYLLMGLGMVIFFPLLTFMSAALPQLIAAVLAFVIVVGLLLMFIKRAVGERTAVVRTGLLLLVFLGLFAVGIITPWRGLLMTLGGLILVGTFMVIYANKAVLPEPPTPPTPEPDADEDLGLDDRDAVEMDEANGSEIKISDHPAEDSAEMIFVPEAKPMHSHCPHCARELEDNFGYCPGCGRETSEIQRCENCGYLQVIPSSGERRYCVKCGNPVDSSELEV